MPTELNEHTTEVIEPVPSPFDGRQQPLQLNYLALMPDGSLETVVDGQVIYRSEPDPGLIELLLEVRRRWPDGERKP